MLTWRYTIKRVQKAEGRTVVTENRCIHRFCAVNRNWLSSIGYLYLVTIILREGRRIRKISRYEGESVLREYFTREVIRTRN